MKIDFIHLLKIIGIEIFYIFGFFIFYSAIINSFFGLNEDNYSTVAYIIYIGLLFIPLSIYNVAKFFQLKKENQFGKSKSYLIVQIMLSVLFFISVI